MNISNKKRNKIGQKLKSTSFIHESKQIYNISRVKMFLKDFIVTFKITLNIRKRWSFYNGEENYGNYRLILQKIIESIQD
jgi:peptide methionine sulfoxide reductase MsrA